MEHIRSSFKSHIIIFMLHRVCPIDYGRLIANENMKVSPEFLERFIVQLKEKDYEFISLDTVYEILHSGEVEKMGRKVVFTLDDGYKDNYEFAYPIFKRHGVPFTIYLTTSFPEYNGVLWWYVIEDLILTLDEITLGNGKRFFCKSLDDKNKVFMEIRSIILTLRQGALLEELNKLFCNYDIDWFSKTKELCMSWEQIIEISKDKLCTIGNHTMSHLSFKSLSEQEIVEEVLKANQIIESKINKKVEHFAYPYGSRNEVDRREFEIIKKLGFKTATTTRHGIVYKKHRKHLECLPRIMLTENFDIEPIRKIRKRVVTVFYEIQRTLTNNDISKQ